MGVFAALVELVLIRPLYKRHIEQVLVTVGLSLSTTALLVAIWGNDARAVPAPRWLGNTTSVLGASIPNDRFVEIVTAIVVLAALNAFLRHTRYGLIIRAGVENRAMVTALGIDVRRAFTLVFAIGGVAAAIAGVLSNVYFGTVDPSRGTSLLIFAFIVVVIGGLGSLRGTAIAAIVVGLVQQYANYYASSGLGDLSVVLLLGIVLLVRPRRPVGELRVKRIVVPVVVLVALALVPKLTVDIPYVFKSSINTPGTLQLLALCLALRRARDDLRPALRLHRAALVRARAVLRGRRLPRRDRDHEVALGLRRGARVHRARRARRCRWCSARCRCASAGSRSRW